MGLSPPRMSAMSAMSGLSGNYNNFQINQLASDDNKKEKLGGPTGESGTTRNHQI